MSIGLVVVPCRSLLLLLRVTTGDGKSHQGESKPNPGVVGHLLPRVVTGEGKGPQVVWYQLAPTGDRAKSGDASHKL